jgi:hypothetical protein
MLHCNVQPGRCRGQDALASILGEGSRKPAAAQALRASVFFEHDRDDFGRCAHARIAA